MHFHKQHDVNAVQWQTFSVSLFCNFEYFFFGNSSLISQVAIYVLDVCGSDFSIKVARLFIEDSVCNFFPGGPSY